MAATPETQAPPEEMTAIRRLFGRTAVPLEERLQILRVMRRQSTPTSERLDRAFVTELERLRKGLDEALGIQQRLQEIVARLTAMPQHPAVLLSVAEGGQAAATVLFHGTRRVVSVAHDVDPAQLVPGDDVLLGPELNVIVGAGGARRTGVVATFDRSTADGRLVLRHRDEEVVVEAAGRLAAAELHGGDLVRWDAQVGMAFERVERSEGRDRFLEETPPETFAMIGGLDRQIEQLQRSIRLHLYHRDVVREFGLRRKGSVLLVGPPGTGKTLLAKALANWMAALSPSGRSRFVNIKPSALHEMWYGRSEENYREMFRAAREAGRREPDVPVVMFFDEVDAIGHARGSSLTATDDRVLNAFMTELDGLEARGNILVVAATNRRDTLDPALLRPGRLGDLELEVPRPSMRAARQILERHLAPGLPYRAGAAGEARDVVIDACLSAVYAPNAENVLAALTLRDGKERVVRAAELMSGASLAKIAADGCERAGLRAIEDRHAAIGIGDVLSAAADEMDRLAAALTPASCRQHLSDLPRDVDVVRVTSRRTRRAANHLHVA